MYEDFMKMAQESLKPVMKMAENNTALAVKLMKAQSETTADLLEGNLAHFQALAESKDLHAAVELADEHEKWPDPYLAGRDQAYRLQERRAQEWIRV